MLLLTSLSILVTSMSNLRSSSYIYLFDNVISHYSKDHLHVPGFIYAEQIEHDLLTVRFEEFVDRRFNS